MAQKLIDAQNKSKKSGSKKKHGHDQKEKLTQMDIIIEEYLNIVSVKQLKMSDLQKKVEQEQEKNYNGDQEFAEEVKPKSSVRVTQEKETLNKIVNINTNQKFQDIQHNQIKEIMDYVDNFKKNFD